MIKLTPVLETVGATTKPGEKMKAIEGLDSDNQKLLMLAQNPFITFGVKKIPNYTCRDGHIAGLEQLGDFFALADKLAERELTGHAALEEIATVLSTYTRTTADTLELVLRKDLRVNMGTTLINKVYKKLVPTFKVMLADKMKADKFDWKAGPWLVEYKYDGMRTLAHVTETSITYWSRSGKEQPRFEGLFNDLLWQMRDQTETDFWADGEVLAPTFQETMQARKEGADLSNLVFQIFDLIYADDWTAQKSTVGNLIRRENIEFLLTDTTEGNVRLSEGILCDTKEEVHTLYENLLEAGAEGVIIKDPDAPYFWKRNKAWIKYKPVWTADLTLMGVYQGTGKYSKVLGGFQLEGELEDGTFVRCDCGSGFNDEDRKEFWENQDKYLGKTIEVEYQEVTKAENADTHSLRFPVYKMVRTDK